LRRYLCVLHQLPSSSSEWGRGLSNGGRVGRLADSRKCSSRKFEFRPLTVSYLMDEQRVSNCTEKSFEEAIVDRTSSH